MRPEWKQEIVSVEQPNNPIPQFELFGYQEDVNLDQRTMKTIMVFISSILFVVVAAAIIFYIKDAKSVHREMISKKGNISDVNPFQGKIELRVTNTKTVQSIDSFFGATRAKPGFRFVVVQAKIRNRAEKDFRISPYGVALFTSDGKRYNPHVAINKLPNAIKSRNLSPEESIEGAFLYEIPRQTSLRSLEIKSYTGPLATYNF